MEFGIGIATSGDSWKLAQRAEELGFTHAWFYDTQMITADPFVAMGAAAVKTKKIRLGTGVLVPSNRLAAVTAVSFATLNQMAPGRIDMGMGTGFSARRAMGLGAMKMKDFEEYIRIVRALLAEETLEADIEGKQRKIRFLNPELGLINTRDPMKLHVSAYGPKTQALAARLDAGWVTFIAGVEGALKDLDAMKQAWAAAGRPADELYATAFTAGCVLRAGESYDSERVIGAAGPRAAVMLHRAADERHMNLPNTSPYPEHLKAEMEGYVALAETFEPPDAKYLTNHRGHFVFVKPEEKKYVTPALIRHATFTASEQELKQRIEALRDGGYSQLTFSITPGYEDTIEDWGRIIQAF
jgi:5,10-methylenetetrahydromethanopterin reductase